MGLATATDTAVWSGHTVTGSDALVMYTYGGDATLDGQINIDDYGIIDVSVGVQGAAFSTELAATAPVARPQDVTSVPEPASICGLLGVLPALARRGRAHRPR